MMSLIGARKSRLDAARATSCFDSTDNFCLSGKALSVHILEPRNIARNHVDFQVHGRFQTNPTKRGLSQSVRNDVYTETSSGDFVDCQGDTVNSD